MSAPQFTAIILAGDRGPGDPLTRAAGVCCKALVPVAGKPMLLRVIDTLKACPSIDETIVAGLPERVALSEPELQHSLADAGIRTTPAGPGPSASAITALKTLPPHQTVLLTTADHALLQPAVVEDFVARATASRLDFVAAVIRFPEFQRRHPDMPKTVMRFSDDRYCGCNLFAVLTPRGHRVLDTWRQVDRQRKTPWKTVSLLGWTSVLRFLIGHLSINEACRRLSQRLDVSLGVVVLPFADAAIDVDSEADWHFVETLVSGNDTE